nr:MAG TPA: hypothetical protein [Caudoviricetes sp.]
MLTPPIQLYHKKFFNQGFLDGVANYIYRN